MKAPVRWIPLILFLAIVVASCDQQNKVTTEKEKITHTNFVVIFADDLGYGDLSSFGNPSIKTPNLDKMAMEGQKWTNFYSAANVCTPSRAALLTGRYAARTGMCSDRRRVLFPDSDGGLPATEITIAKALKEKGYATAAVGKWHLGHLPQYLPTSHGFDQYYGIPYSNDMDRVNVVDRDEAFARPKPEYFQVPLLRNEEEIERPADQNTITKRYTEEAVKFINDNKEKPFFLYLAHSLPHVPLFASSDFTGKSKRGLYGDVIQEIDWSAGEIVKALQANGLDKNTLVVFTSDNGPWVIFDEQGGSSGPLFGAKGTGYEGGQREPTIFWGMDSLKSGVVNEMGSTLDLFPTILSLAGAAIPSDRIYDGYDLTPVLVQNGPTPRKEMIFYHGTRIFAARLGDHKLYFYKNNPDGYPERMEELENPHLFNVMVDPGEQYDVINENPEVVEEIMAMVEKHKANMEMAPTQLEKRIEPGDIDKINL